MTTSSSISGVPGPGPHRLWGQVQAATGQVARIRVEYFQETGASALSLTWKKPGDAAFVKVPGGQLAPAYNLVTSSTADDSVGTDAPANVVSGNVPSITSATSYGSSPWLGLPATSVVDPAAEPSNRDHIR